MKTINAVKHTYKIDECGKIYNASFDGLLVPVEVKIDSEGNDIVELLSWDEKGNGVKLTFKVQDLMNEYYPTVKSEIESKEQVVEDTIEDAVLTLPEGCEMVYENKRYDIEKYNDMLDTTENILAYIDAKIKVLSVNKALDDLERIGYVMNCVLDADAFGEFEEGELKEVHDESYYQSEIINLLRINLMEFVTQAVRNLPKHWSITFKGRYSILKGEQLPSESLVQMCRLELAEEQIAAANLLLGQLNSMGVRYYPAEK